MPAIAAVVGETRAEHFVHGTEFDFAMWNHAQDSGRSWADAEAAAKASHPDLAEEISAYRPNFALSLPGLVPGTAEILRALHDRGVRLVALTNWSAETIHHGPEIFPEVFDLFDDIVVSGAEGVAKPDREIFQILARRLTHPISGVFYVDDSPRNVDAARAAGMDPVRFTDAATLLEELKSRGLLDDLFTIQTAPEERAEFAAKRGTARSARGAGGVRGETRHRPERQIRTLLPGVRGRIGMFARRFHKAVPILARC